MKQPKNQLKRMYEYAKEEFKGGLIDIYEVKNAYRDIAEEFNLDVEFGIDGNEYPGDDEIYCYIHVNGIGSIVFDRGVRRFTDENSYKDAVNHLLKLEGQAEKIREKLLILNQL